MCSERGCHRFRLRPEEVSGRAQLCNSVSLPASICRTHTRPLTCRPQGLSRTGVARLRKTEHRRSRTDPTGPTLELCPFDFSDLLRIVSSHLLQHFSLALARGVRPRGDQAGSSWLCTISTFPIGIQDTQTS